MSPTDATFNSNVGASSFVIAKPGIVLGSVLPTNSSLANCYVYTSFLVAAKFGSSGTTLLALLLRSYRTVAALRRCLPLPLPLPLFAM